LRLLYERRDLALAFVLCALFTFGLAEFLYCAGRIQKLLGLFIAADTKNCRKSQKNDCQNYCYNARYSQCLYHVSLPDILIF